MTVNKVPLEQVEAFKYLGVFFSSDLSWSMHVDSICAKGKKLIGLLYRPYAIPYVTKRETDSGRKSGYYAAILSGKEDPV